jgi:hypothetical protein
MDLYIPKRFHLLRRKASLVPLVGVGVAVALIGASLYLMSHGPSLPDVGGLAALNKEIEQVSQDLSGNAGSKSGSNHTTGTIKGAVTGAIRGAGFGKTGETASSGAQTASESANGGTTVQAKAAGGVQLPALPQETETAAPSGSPAATKGDQEADIETIFALVMREQLGKLDQDGEGRLMPGRHSTSVIPTAATRIQSLTKDGGLKILESENHSIPAGQSSLVFRGSLKGNDTVGVYVDTSYIRPTDHGFEMRVSLRRSIAETNPTTGEITVVSDGKVETVNLPKGSALAISGSAPHRPVSEPEAEYYQPNLLRIMLDPSYQKGEMELVILILRN